MGLKRTTPALPLFALAILTLGALVAPVAARVPTTPSSTETTVASAPAAAAATQQAREAYAKLPMSLIPNLGQVAAPVDYYAQGAGYRFSFTRDEVVLAFEKRGARTERARPADAPGTAASGTVLALGFLGANPDVTLEAGSPLPGQVNYLRGNDPAKWRSAIPTYAELAYRGLWSGIDMVVRGDAGRLKYEFHLSPGARVEDIRLAYRGAEGLALGADGGLQIETPLGVLLDAAPRSYQVIQGERVSVESRFALGEGAYGFALGAGYDPSHPLVVDPAIAYSTYLGGGSDSGRGIAVDFRGNAYVTGFTTSPDFPTTLGAFQGSRGGGFDAFVTKIDLSGSALAYSTYLGGSGDEIGFGIAVDFLGSAYVTGFTTSPDFPTTPGAFQESRRGQSDAFVTKVDPAGSTLVYSTYLGGSGGEGAFGIAVDLLGSAYVTGETNSTDFPTTPGAFQGSRRGQSDAFVTKLSRNGSALVFSTYLGGSGDEVGFGIAVDFRGNAYVTGQTRSPDFPTTPSAFQGSRRGESDAFVTKIDLSGSALAYSTYLGGSDVEVGRGIAVDFLGNAYVTGITSSTDFPTTPGAFQEKSRGPSDAFVTKLDGTGSALAYSTYLGGSDSEAGRGIAVDLLGSAYVTGETRSANFPTTADAFQGSRRGQSDAFVTKLSRNGSALVFSTYLGGSGEEVGFGIAVDFLGNAYVIGETDSSDFPTTPGAFQEELRGPDDAFVTKIRTAVTAAATELGKDLDPWSRP